MGFTTDPVEVTVTGGTVSAIVEPEPDGSWLVTVVISRSPPPPAAIDGADVDAELFGSDSRALPQIERPTGRLVEAGGSNSTSANGSFRFAHAYGPPAELEVRWQGYFARFHLTPRK